MEGLLPARGTRDTCSQGDIVCAGCGFFYGDIRLYPDMPLQCPECASVTASAFADIEHALERTRARRAVRCEECELEAARMAYRAGLGASEWKAFIGRVPWCRSCSQVAVLRGDEPHTEGRAVTGPVPPQMCAAYVGAPSSSIRKRCRREPLEGGRYCDEHRHLERLEP